VSIGTVGRGRLRGAIRASYGVFAMCGFLLASFTSRIPQIRSHLHLDPSRLGTVLLAAAVGSFLSRPFARSVVVRLGQRGTVTVTALMAAAGLAVAGLGDVTGLAAVVAGLLVIGFASAVWDVAMNVQGTQVERALGRSIMPRLHAGFSIGTVAGALLGVAMVAADVPVVAHLGVAALIIAIAVPLAARDYLPDHHQPPADELGTAGEPGDGTRAAVPSAWLEPRTVLIGLFVLAFAFGEGAANDWISIALIDGYQAPAVLGTVAFATFLTAVTAARWFGSRLLDAYGRVAVLRGSGILAIAGLLLFVFGPNLAVAFAGVTLWGAGVAFGYPVGMSAGADDPRHATARVTVVSTIGKLATFAGPPLIGLLGDHVTVLRALLVVAALQAVAVLIASVTGQSVTGQSVTDQSVTSPAASPPDGDPEKPTTISDDA
jgi:predicted MFS family arabinose efflux permease